MKDDEFLTGRVLQRTGRRRSSPISRACRSTSGWLRCSRRLRVDALRGAIHSESPVRQPTDDRLLSSDVPNRRRLALYENGHVEAAVDPTFFMNGNALMADREHGRRCISRSQPDPRCEPEPVVTRLEGKRLN
jgi:gluconolactonase